MHAWDYAPEHLSLDYEEITSWISKLPDYLSYYEPINYHGLDGASPLGIGTDTDILALVHRPPTHRGLVLTGIRGALSIEEAYPLWVKQTMLFCFLYKFYRLLEDGMGIAPTNLLRSHSWADIEEHLMDTVPLESYGAHAPGFTAD